MGIVKGTDNRFRNYLFSIVRDNKIGIVKLVLTSLSVTLLSIGTNYYLKNIIEGIPKSDTTYLILVFVIFLNIYFFKNLFTFLRNKVNLYFNSKIDKKINKKVINHIFNLPYKFFSKRSTGELSTIVADVENFKDIVNKVFIIVVIDFIMIFAISIYLAVYNIYFTLLSYIILLIILVLSKKYQNLLDDSFLKLKQSKIRFSSYLIDSLASYSTIKNLNIEKEISTINNKNYKDVIAKQNAYTSLIYKYDFSNNSVNELYYLLIIFVSSMLCLNNSLSLSDVTLFSSMFYMIISFYNNLGEVVAMSKMYKSSIIRVLDVLDVEEENFKPSKLQGINRIDISNLSFKLGNKTILNDLNLEIKSGDKIFIEGSSGIGKSSLIKILLKYYEGSEGSIKIDNIDLKYVNTLFIRNNITYVSQNETLFNDTLYNNMKLISTSKSKINKAFLTCNVNEIFKNKEVDYNFILEDNASNISGGERKRIIIARGLLKAKSILVLDESFNEIGVESERQILSNIFNNYHDLTIILISHRKNNIDLFNKKFKISRRNE